MKLPSLGLGLGMLVASLLPLWIGQQDPPSADLQRELADERARNATLEAENARLSAELETLRAELQWSSEQRYVEQQNFQYWLEVVSSMKPKGVTLVLPPGLNDPTPVVAPEPEVGLDAGFVRAAEMVTSLRNLFKSEGLYAYDLLEGGRLANGKLGPVVFRLLDDRGRLAGSLTARQLSFEAGRTGRTVTLVLQGGEKRRGGTTTAFAERRIPFLSVDPRPWVAKLPELFPESELGIPLNDGKWDLAALRARLNNLLAADVAAGYLRLDAIEGVAGQLLFGLDFAELDPEGHVRRHVFADTAELALLDRGVMLQLFGSVSIRGGVKAPFPGGVHRVFLPRADQAAWRAARLPGLVAPAGSTPGE